MAIKIIGMAILENTFPRNKFDIKILVAKISYKRSDALMMYISKISCIAWTIAVFFYYFQVPFLNFAWLITTGVAIFMLLDIKKIFDIFRNFRIGILYLVVISFCLINVLYSVSNGTELSSALRFFWILILLPLCPFYQKENAYTIYKVFEIFSLGKAIMLIVLAFLVYQAGSYAEMRTWAQMNNYGDIYYGYANIPKIQLKGNALLLIAFMIDFCKSNKFNVYNVVILLGVLCAGNFAFLLGLAIFFVWRYASSLKYNGNIFRKALVGVILLIGITLFSSYSIMESNTKSGYFGSNGMRIIQYEILTDTNIIYGSGLGSNVPGAVRLGRSIDDQYYELQTLYIYYQVGIICLGFFYIIMFYTMRRSCDKDGFVLFLIYLFYSFFNPYCFDTTQMITMILLSNQFPREVKK